MKKRRFKLTIRIRNSITGYLFILPWIIGLFAFSLYPVVYSVILSVHNIAFSPGNITMVYKGFEYYYQAINVNLDFKPNLLNDVQYMLSSLPFVMVFSLIVAVLLNGKYRLRAFFRVVFFLPVVIVSGPIILNLLGQVDNFNWEMDPVLEMIFSSVPETLINIIIYVLTNLVSFLWFSGVQILIFLAGLQKIDRSVYEAAEIDGSGKWESFWKITLPYMKSLILINAMYTIIEIANFGGTYNVADTTAYDGRLGPPGSIQANLVNSLIIRNLTASSAPYSFSAAMSWIYTGVVLLILLAVFGLYKLFDRGDRD